MFEDYGKYGYRDKYTGKVYRTREEREMYEYRTYMKEQFYAQKHKPAPVYEPEEIGLDSDQLKRLGIE